MHCLVGPLSRHAIFWPEVLEQSKRVGLNPYLVLSGAPLASPEGYARRGCR